MREGGAFGTYIMILQMFNASRQSLSAADFSKPEGIHSLRTTVGSYLSAPPALPEAWVVGVK